MHLIKKIIKSKVFLFMLVVLFLVGLTYVNPLLNSTRSIYKGVIPSSRGDNLQGNDALKNYETNINTEKLTVENSDSQETTKLVDGESSKFKYLMGIFHTKSDTDFVLKDVEGKPIILEYNSEDATYISSWRAGQKLIIEYIIDEEGKKIFVDIVPGDLSEDDLRDLLSGTTTFNGITDSEDSITNSEVEEEVILPDTTLDDFFTSAGFEVTQDEINEVDFIDSERSFRTQLAPVEFPNGISVVEHPVKVAKAEGVMFIVSWSAGEGQQVVPKTDEVLVEIKTPSGTLITPENIEKYGTVWREQQTYFYCINLSYAGEWVVVMSKDKRAKLGVGSIQAIPIDGVAKVDYAKVKVIEGKLAAVWNIKGIPDDNYIISINAKKSEGDDLIPLASLSSVTDGIRKKGKTVISTSKLKPGVYDIYFIVKNIDLTQDYLGVGRKTTKDEYIIREVEIK